MSVIGNVFHDMLIGGTIEKIMRILVNIFHIFIVAPLLYTIGIGKGDKIIPYLPAVAMFIVVTHTYKVVTKLSGPSIMEFMQKFLIYAETAPKEEKEK